MQRGSSKGQRGSSLMNRLSGKPKYEDDRGNRKWIHDDKQLTDNFVIYQAKYLGWTQVDSPRGIEVVKDAIKRLQFQRELKKSEAGKKGSKLPKVEVWVSIDVIKIVSAKTKEIITQRPLHRISYCADDHNDKKLFTFIAKEQESKTHNCYAFITEREAAEFTVTLGQAFDLAYKRYLAKGAKESKENKEVLDLKKQVEQAKAENELLRQKLNDSVSVESQRSESINSFGSGNSLPEVPESNKEAQPSALLDFGEPVKQDNAPQEGLEFDQYLSSLVSKRGLGPADVPDLQERAPFQSPIQKVPADHPFESPQPNPSNPFDTFFVEKTATPEREGDGSELNSFPQVSPSTTGPSLGVLPPPPSKQKIKAENAMKMKPINGKPLEERVENSHEMNGMNGKVEPAQSLPEDLFGFGVPNDPSVNSLEQSLGSGLQFDSLNFDPLQ